MEEVQVAADLLAVLPWEVTPVNSISPKYPTYPFPNLKPRSLNMSR